MRRLTHLSPLARRVRRGRRGRGRGRGRAVRRAPREAAPRRARPTRAEAGAGMGRRADVPQPVDGRGMPRPARERPPQEVLVEARARRRTGRRGRGSGSPPGGQRERGDALQDRRLEVGDVPRDPRLDPVGVALAQLLRPRPVAGVDLARGVALHVPRELLELDPEDAPPSGRAARVDRERLPDDDRRLGRQQPALGLVHRPRDAVEPGREVDDRRLPRAARRRPSAAAPRARSGSASRSARSGSGAPSRAVSRPARRRAAARRAGSA